MHRIAGQVGGIEKMIADDRYCIDIRPRPVGPGGYSQDRPTGDFGPGTASASWPGVTRG
jgi:hypothetical protein